MSAAAAALPPSAARKPPGPLEEVPRIALPGRADVAWLAIATCGVNVLALALPLLMLQVFDRILPFRSMDTLLLLVAGTVAAVAGEALLRLMRSYMLVWAATRFEHRSMCDAMSRLLATPPERLESGTAERFKAIVSLKDYFSGQSFVQVLDLPFTALYLALVAMIGGPMVAVPIVFAGLFAFLNYRMGRQHGALFRERQGADRRRNNFLLETLSGIHTVKAMAMEAFMLRRYERLQEGCANLTRRLAEALDVSSGLGALFSPLLTILVVAVGGALLVLGQLTNGELAACIMLILRSLGPMQRAGSLWIGHQQVRVLHEEIRPLFSHPPLAERPTARPDTAAAGRLELRAAGYRLPGAPAAIIEGVSVAITPGETVVIRGANGSGRSTLLQLLAGLLPPSSGEVLLDGEPLTALDPAALREAVAYVPENAQLFEGTILQNISGFDPSRVEHALKVAAALGLDKYVSRLPRGWDSAVGNAAADTTPVGHRQRIAMVRALAGGARVVLFDGANVSMDSEGDAALRSYLEAEKGRTTFIIVTLRPSLQRLADRVLVMESGRLVLDLPASDPQAWASLEAAPAEAAPADAPDSPAEAPVLAPAPLTPEARWERTRLAILNSFSRPGDLALCLTELLKALGWKGEPRDVAEALPYFEDTLDLSGLLNCLAQVGFHGSGARLALREIDPRLLPCLFIPDKGAAVVLLSADRGVLRAYDPVVGGPRDLAGSLKGEAYFFTPAERDDGPQSGWAMRMLSRLRPLVAHAMFAALVFGLVMLPAPFFVMAVFGYIMPSGSLLNLAYLTAGACAAVLIGAFFVVYRASILSYIAGRIDYLFGTAVFKQIMALPPSMSESASIGAQIARLSSFESIRELFTGPLMSTLLESPALLAFVIALGVVNPAALLAVGVTLALYVLLYSLCNAAVDRHVAEFARRSTQRHEFLVEATTKLRTIREFGGEQIWMARFRELSAATTMAGYRVGRISAALSAGSYLMTTLGTLAVLVVSIVFAASNIFGVGVVIASMMLTWRIIGPIQTAFINLTRIDRVRNATSQVDRLMALRAERSGGPIATTARSFTGRVELERVSFRYSLDTDPALVGASFVVEPGTLVAVTGPNGSGKSTLLKLLAGLYQPQAGSIRLDGMDLRQIDPLELRRAIGYVPQESSLFRGTIAQNLRLVRPAATDDELQRALALAGAMNDVAILPEGIGTRVGDGATERLSASLRQKLALARAYLTRAPVLLFDEPAAALDMDGDRWFVEALRKLKGHGSIFLVTHRPSHIRLADVAVVLQGGFVRSIGTPAEALKRMGIKL